MRKKPLSKMNILCGIVGLLVLVAYILLQIMIDIDMRGKSCKITLVGFAVLFVIWIFVLQHDYTRDRG